MLPLSSFTITLGKSTNYLRLACLIHVLAAAALIHSSLSWSITMGLSCALLVSLIPIVRSKIPVPAFVKLSYHTHYWLLHDIQGNEFRYEDARVGFDGGLFFLLTLSNEDGQKKLVIFNDQLTTAQYSALNVIGKIAPRKKRF